MVQVVLLSILLLGSDAPKASDPARPAASVERDMKTLVGTWELTRKESTVSANVRRLKFMTPTHYVWVVYGVAQRPTMQRTARH